MYYVREHDSQLQVKCNFSRVVMCLYLRRVSSFLAHNQRAPVFLLKYRLRSTDTVCRNDVPTKCCFFSISFNLFFF